jgi:tRNA(Ile)-lysidine synthase
VARASPPLPQGERDSELDAASFAALMSPLGPFETKPRLAVAVSGGADSLALALLLADWARERGGEAVALTVDHRLRPESGAEARQVQRWLRARGVGHRILRRDGPAPAADLQAVARQARYRLLADWCARTGVLHLALAHHRDDQAETLLLRLARGSGLDGLAGMAAIGTSPFAGGLAAAPRLLRPLLGVPKAALEAFLRAAGQDWIEDPSNDNDAFARVRMRRLLPELSVEGLSPARLAATAARLSRARGALDDAVAGLAGEAVALFPTGYARLDPAPYLRAAPETALRCLAHLLMTLGGEEHTPRLERLERLHRWVADPAGARVRTLAGCRLERHEGGLLICRETAAANEESAARPGETIWWDRRFLLRLAHRGSGFARIARLGTAGWTQVRAQAQDAGIIPAPVRLSLPALWDKRGLLEVPSLGYRRTGGRGPRVESLEFAPARPLAGDRFMVV